MWDLLIANIARRGVHLTGQEVEILKSLFIYKKLRKHQYILQEGEVSTHDNSLS
jgi:hypothetical protein